MPSGRLKIAVLIGDSEMSAQGTAASSLKTRDRTPAAPVVRGFMESKVAAIAKLCDLPAVEVRGVLLDTAHDTARKRWRNLRRNIRREGLSYIPYRLLSALRSRLDAWADRVIPQQEVDELLRAAFPERDLRELARARGFPLHEVSNLNAPAAVECLRQCDADLGIVMGTRILSRTVFSVPRLGCINLHKGEVPSYRGMPPGFWEIYDGCESAGVTVHFVDDGLDTGDVVGSATVPIHPRDTPDSLRKKLDLLGARLLCETVEQIAAGTARRQPQEKTGQKPRTRPTRREIRELERRLPHWRKLPDGREALKNAIWLALFYGGFYSFLRWLRRGRSRGAILLYHRVNDVSEDVLTVSTRRFAAHLVTLRRYYHPAGTEEIVDCVAAGRPLRATSVAIHFDDCYRDVRTAAALLLAAAGIPATAFVSSGFVDTDLAFRHDVEHYPHRFENFRAQDLRELPALGVSVAAHTVNHVDLGSVELAQARVEVVESRRQLEQITCRPVLLFSFPFGRVRNLREEVRQMIIAAGYRALFSAYGGFVNGGTSLFDIPRMGVSSDHSPLALMMELEGITVGRLKQWLMGRSRS